MHLSRMQWVPALLLGCALSSWAATITYTGAGGDLPDATVNTGTVIPGVFTSDITVSGSGNIAATGVNAIVTLVGFYHPYSGDLVVELINVANSLTGTVFSRICKTTPTAPYPDPDPGCLADFAPGSSNYVFRSDSTNDLWATAMALGDADAIPTSDYFPSLPLTGAPSNLSFMFNGLDPNGVWRLRITDYYPDSDTDAPPVYRGNLQAWQLTLVTNDATTVPEPATAATMGMAAAALSIWTWRKRR